MLRNAGIDANVLRLTNIDPDAPIMIAKGQKVVGVTGFHEVVQINTVQGPRYIDSLVYESYGVTPVDWETYIQLWEYPDAIIPARP